MLSGSLSVHRGLCLRMWVSILGTVVLLMSGMAVASASEKLSSLDQALENVRASGLYFRVDLSLEVFNATDEIPTVLLNTTTPVTSPIATTSSSTVTGNPGSVSLSDNAQGNLSALVNIIGAGKKA